ncbi:MAG: pirin family protein [Candidatus Wenzhouxiangella sp. M2_3B_020]
MNTRGLQHRVASVETSDGAGVRLRRSIGTQPRITTDPFLLLDEFSSDDPDDYIAGFPAHPHRGFETVTYMLDGRMLHEDHLGHRSVIGPGDVQWMTAGRGIIHSEMPQQERGRMRGFQLWINLPAAEKMKPAAYRDIAVADIPVVDMAGGARIRVVAGEVQGVRGPVDSDRAMATRPVYLDVSLAPDSTVELPLAAGLNAVAYAFEGRAGIGSDSPDALLEAHQAGVLSDGDVVALSAGSDGARLLLLAGRPLREPVVQYGPFVMNRREEIEQAMRDYRDGRLTA